MSTLDLLDHLCAMPAETEWLEFKTAASTFEIEELGQYVSALANEANLCGRPNGWLIFGVENKRDSTSGMRSVVGSLFKNSVSALNELKLQISNATSPNIALTNIAELSHVDCRPSSRVIMFEIPAAPRGNPVSWKGHWWGRAGESLVPLGTQKLDAIRAQAQNHDWSSQFATDDWTQLDAAAILRARDLYLRKNPRQMTELANWNDERFLTELRIARAGKLTRAAIILLGSANSAVHLDGASPRLTWKLVDANAKDIDYEHFELPLLLAIDSLTAKIRLHTVRILPPQQLAPFELPNYEGWVIREALLNCIAHQDYGTGGRVTVTESPDTLLFSNGGRFLGGTIDELLFGEAPPHQYRNPCLADAMVKLDLIDTVGSGIKKMFRMQRERSFPLPDFSIDNSPPSVRVRVYGRELDAAFTNVLLSNIDLQLSDVVALDRVQKKQPIEAAVLSHLRKLNLVEGRSPNYFIAAAVANATNQRAQYAKNRGLQKPAQKQLVLNLIDKFGSATREEINQTLLGTLPSLLTNKQKTTKIRNLLTEMATKDESIVANRRGVGGAWKRTT
jgi:ATP-dependent DNA helicase RecG